ncbi:MAG: phosphotransferase, partial [Desulfobacterales bacterium]|nr:phosphotransferase [Desulfobacterales bacterium]
ALIRHAIENGLTIVAGIVVNRHGATFVAPDNSDSLFAIYEYLPGKDRYTWDNPALSHAEFANAARVLAEFHNAVRAFDPAGLKRKELPIRDLWPGMAEKLKGLFLREGGGKLTPYYLAHLQEILDTVGRHPLGPAEVDRLPVIPTHYDFHPGNLKWDQARVVGIFDFDWAKMDLRLFDVCLALVYFCGQWDGRRDGEVRLRPLAIFLGAYQARLRELAGLAPIAAPEMKLLPKMMTIANIYLLHWGVNLYQARENLNDYEYLAYLKHSVRLMRWIEAHREAIEDTAGKTLV